MCFNHRWPLILNSVLLVCYITYLSPVLLNKFVMPSSLLVYLTTKFSSHTYSILDMLFMTCIWLNFELNFFLKEIDCLLYDQDTFFRYSLIIFCIRFSGDVAELGIIRDGTYIRVQTVLETRVHLVSSRTFIVTYLINVDIPLIQRPWANSDWDDFCTIGAISHRGRSTFISNCCRSCIYSSLGAFDRVSLLFWYLFLIFYTVFVGCLVFTSDFTWQRGVRRLHWGNLTNYLLLIHPS